jgi:hypothetical protein
MKAVTSRLALTLLVIVLSTPALAQDVATKTKTCKPGSTKGNCLLALITTLQGQVTTLQTALSTANANITTLQTALTAVQSNNALALGPYVSVDANSENGLAGPNVIISGANVHIESGSGTTVDSTGLGNLVVGYDEDSMEPATIDVNRTGSHNLIVGPQHEFTASGGVVIGFANFTGANYAGVTGGECNTAGGALIPLKSCGSTLGASEGANVSGGFGNSASGNDSSISGGGFNQATNGDSSISGGAGNISSGTSSSVSGGAFNTASTPASSVSGGQTNTASGFRSSVSGGENNVASGNYSSILGGNGVTVSTAGASDGGDAFTP